MEPELLADHLGMYTSLTLKRSFFQTGIPREYNTSDENNLPGYDNMMQWEGGDSDGKEGTVMGRRGQ